MEQKSDQFQEKLHLLKRSIVDLRFSLEDGNREGQENILKNIEGLLPHLESYSSKANSSNGNDALNIYRQIIETINDMVIYYDTNLNFQWANISAMEGLNIDAETTRKKCFEILNCDLENSPDCALRNTLDSKEPKSCQQCHRGGKFFTVQCFPTFDGLGNINGVVEIIKDLSEQYKKENIIRESEERYKKMFDNAKDAMMHLDPVTGRFTLANPALFDLFGIKDLCEFDSLSPWDISPEMQPNGVLSTIMAKEMIHRAIVHGSNYFEWQHKRRNGETFDAKVLLVKITLNGRDLLQATVRDITEKKKAEKKLKESLERYKALLAATPDLMFVYNKEGVFIDYHASKPELLMLPPSLFLNQHTNEVLPEYLAKITLHNLNLAIETGQPREYNYSLEVSGEWREYEARLVPFDTNKALAITRDVTERHKNEVALQQAHETYRGILDSIMDAVYILDKQGVFLSTNKTVEQWYGLNREQIIGQTPAFLAAPGMNDLGKVFHDLQEAYNGKSSRFEFWAKRSDGSIFPKEVVLTNGIYFGNKVVIAVGRDITERKKTEQQLKHHSQLQQILMEISANYINLPLDRVDDAVNDSLSKLGEFVNADRAYVFNYNFEKEICTNTHEWCAPGIESEIKFLQAVPLSSMTECIDMHKEGKTMYVPDVSAMPAGKSREILEPQKIRSLINVPMMHNSSPIGFVGFDSVKQTHSYSFVEQQLLEVYAQILVNIKLRKQAGEELMHTLSRAEESDKLKTAFLANISHEIRTPLNGIIGFTSLIGTPGLTPERHNYYLNIITSSANQLTGIINDVVEIAKVETGQIKLFEQETDVCKIIKKSTEHYRKQAEQKEIEITANLPVGIKELIVVVDKEKIAKVLSNLISNAIKFTEKGRVEVGLKVQEDFLEYYVKDTGIGISPSHHGHIFERFRQVEIEASRRYGGTGLGLTIAKAYVEAMGGSIHVFSDIYKGSTFFFTIPIKTAERVDITEHTGIKETLNLKGKK